MEGVQGKLRYWARHEETGRNWGRGGEMGGRGRAKLNREEGWVSGRRKG